jgi:hypothetical protein
MDSSIDFMRQLEADYQVASGLKNRSQYKIFYGQIIPAFILTLGKNPGGRPEETSPDGTRGKGGMIASASASFFEDMKNDVLDCHWPENTGLQKLLLPLVNNDLNRFRYEIVKTNIAFRRSRTANDIDLKYSEEEAAPFIARIIRKVNPKLILLTGVPISRFLELYALTHRPLVETIRDSRIGHVIFSASSAQLKETKQEITVIQVAHASQFNWTYTQYNVPGMISEILTQRSITNIPQSPIEPPSNPPLPSNTTQLESSLTPHSRNQRLNELAMRWRLLNIEDLFFLVHHLERKRETLHNFIKYCDGKNLQKTNLDTIDRALDLASRMEHGANFADALQAAKAAYPLPKG